jgi:predicted transcriptional regulator
VISRSDLLIHECEDKKQREGVHFREASIDGINDVPRPSVPMTVQDMMTPAVFAVSENTPVSRVVSDMLGLRVHRLFVVDQDGTLVGIITTMDVLKHLTKER